MSKINTKHGRPAKITDQLVIEYIQKNPEDLSNKELCRKFDISMPTLLKIKFARGAYAVA